MKKRNQDPSRDILQGMLNPYDELADTSKRSPHPFSIENYKRKGAQRMSQDTLELNRKP